MVGFAQRYNKYILNGGVSLVPLGTLLGFGVPKHLLFRRLTQPRKAYRDRSTPSLLLDLRILPLDSELVRTGSQVG